MHRGLAVAIAVLAVSVAQLATVLPEYSDE
jgi:hypothetical protein